MLILIVSMSNVSFCQNTTLSSEINRSVGNAFVLLNDLSKKETKCFFLKLTVGDQSIIQQVDISDGTDSLLKSDFLNHFKFVNIQKQLELNKMSQVIVLIPIYISSIDRSEANKSELFKFGQFNGSTPTGAVYMAEPCIIKTKFSQKKSFHYVSIN